MANQRTEDVNITVAVVEAGVFPEDVYDNFTRVPGDDTKFYGGTPDIECSFMTTPQTMSLPRLPWSLDQAERVCVEMARWFVGNQWCNCPLLSSQMSESGQANPFVLRFTV